MDAPWKRVAKYLALIAGLLLLAAVSLVAFSVARRAPIQDGLVLEQFAETVKGVHVASFLLDAGGGEVALVDAGDDFDGRALLAALTRRGLTAAAVSAVFLTHGHPDHVAGCHLFPRARIYVGEGDAAIAEGRATSRGVLARLYGAKALGVRTTDVLHDGDEVRVGALSVRVYALPGHTPGSVAYLVRGVLFLGDSADASRGGRLLPAKWGLSDDLELNRHSLKALALRLPPGSVRALAFGHSGAVLSSEPLIDFASTQ
jgi:hydroxyacylglutathione hydrolase